MNKTRQHQNMYATLKVLSSFCRISVGNLDIYFWGGFSVNPNVCKTSKGTVEYTGAEFSSAAFAIQSSFCMALSVIPAYCNHAP